eukprot:6256843-Alexandrium_andersonii.AAC.1
MCEASPPPLASNADPGWLRPPLSGVFDKRWMRFRPQARIHCAKTPPALGVLSSGARDPTPCAQNCFRAL